MDALPDQVKRTIRRYRKITEVIDMSINRDMKSYRLQKEETVRTPSGAEKQKWIDMGGVKAAVYKKNDEGGCICDLFGIDTYRADAL